MTLIILFDESKWYLCCIVQTEEDLTCKWAKGIQKLYRAGSPEAWTEGVLECMRTINAFQLHSFLQMPFLWQIINAFSSPTIMNVSVHTYNVQSIMHKCTCVVNLKGQVKCNHWPIMFNAREKLWLSISCSVIWECTKMSPVIRTMSQMSLFGHSN